MRSSPSRVLPRLAKRPGSRIRCSRPSCRGARPGFPAYRRRDPRAHERQHLPLRRLSEHRGCGEEGGRRRMNSFTYVRASNLDAAVREGARANTYYLGAGTNLLDLMKGGVEQPMRLVDVTRLPLAPIEE